LPPLERSIVGQGNIPVITFHRMFGGRFLRKKPVAAVRSDKILVSANCQTGGTAAALRRLLPRWHVDAVPLAVSGDDRATRELTEKLKDAAIWVTQGQVDLAASLPTRVIMMPDIYFDAFHPDLRGATKGTSGIAVDPAYNSQIGIWAYNNRIEPEDAVRLFTPEVFEALGYFSCWPISVVNLRNRFIRKAFDQQEFRRFFLRVKRRGAFMHAVNHPKVQTLVELARLIARRVEPAVSADERDIEVPDALTGDLWPIYPAIGEQLGIEGHYRWSYTDGQPKELDGLRSYLEYAYSRYTAQEIRPTELTCRKPVPHLDDVLNARIQHS
jgi:Polysaccharide biosynthesis enzyme WcbI